MGTPPITGDALDQRWHQISRRRIHRAPLAIRSVLAGLLAEPDLCTSELGELDAVHGQGNASRVLEQLERMGLARSVEETRGPAGGRPYRLWRLTGQGTRLARLAGQ